MGTSKFPVFYPSRRRLAPASFSLSTRERASPALGVLSGPTMAQDRKPVILGLSGSLRRGSFNSMLLAAAAPLMPEGIAFEILSIREIPLYDGDREAAEGPPGPVAALKERLARADGLLVSTPEYNNSIPGVVKNAIDWLSRPAADIPRVFGDLPVALMGATPGRGATLLAQAAWLPVLRVLGTRPWFGGWLAIAGAGTLFDADGLHDEATRSRLARHVHGFAEFVRESNRGANHFPDA
jgi:chromate reductase